MKDIFINFELEYQNSKSERFPVSLTEKEDECCIRALVGAKNRSSMPAQHFCRSPHILLLDPERNACKKRRSAACGVIDLEVGQGGRKRQVV